ncbi:TPA: hypothetical protein OLY09_003116 [Clostridioides difficile]|nr:hypothetical protein [Clostridioides difficile]MCM4101915.1 hypothetical protein [Clostridioides difficile]MDI6157505.1 hypothetical protein [Clostridioides difficile]HCQ5581861.1 hypothetical protein [Clostridioides difficile]
MKTTKKCITQKFLEYQTRLLKREGNFSIKKRLNSYNDVLTIFEIEKDLLTVKSLLEFLGKRIETGQMNKHNELDLLIYKNAISVLDLELNINCINRVKMFLKMLKTMCNNFTFIMKEELKCSFRKINHMCNKFRFKIISRFN